MKLSKSKVNTYLKCPREFKFQYIDEIEMKPNKYMALGSDVHLIAEKFTDKFEDNLDDVDIQNELIKVANELDIGYGLDEHIDNYVTKNRSHITQIIWTRDAHKDKDKSFEVNGGTWPIHCVDGTPGSKLPDLYYKFMKMGIKTEIFNKGTDPNHEEYGAFEHCGTFHHLHPNDPPHVKNCYFANTESSSGCRITTEKLTVCGIAGDYCVKETIKNLLKHWRSFDISVLMDGVVSIDGGTALNELIEEKNLKKI